MDLKESLSLEKRDEWRVWLQKNYRKKTEVWLIFFKKHTGRSCISYEEAVEEALCYGWIDSIVKRIDDERYAQKFTPRTDSRRWSASNVRRVKKLIHEGMMTKAGLALIDESVLKRKIPPTPSHLKEIPIPPRIKKMLASHTEAWKYFTSLAPSYRNLYIRWILDAKKEETREKRLEEAVRYLGQKKKLPLK